LPCISAKNFGDSCGCWTVIGANLLAGGTPALADMPRMTDV
jgi:hypothetical protein